MMWWLSLGSYKFYVFFIRILNFDHLKSHISLEISKLQYLISIFGCSSISQKRDHMMVAFLWFTGGVGREVKPKMRHVIVDESKAPPRWSNRFNAPSAISSLAAGPTTFVLVSNFIILVSLYTNIFHIC